MVTLNCIEFKANDKIISRDGGNKDSYDVQENAYISNGMNIGEMEISAKEFSQDRPDARIMDNRIVLEMENNLNKRVTKEALRVKNELAMEEKRVEESQPQH